MGSGARTRIQPPGRQERRDREREGEHGWGGDDCKISGRQSKDDDDDDDDDEHKKATLKKD